MTYSTDEVRNHLEIIDSALNGGRLNAWSTKFLTDIKAQFERYDTKTRLSDKQINKLHEIILSPQAIGMSLPRRPRLVARSGQYGRQSGRSRGLGMKRGVLAREVRWFAWRLLVAVSFIAVLAVGLAVYTVIKDGSISFTSYLGSAKAIVFHQFTITDGDTVRVVGERKGTRLVGFNTPETYNPKCAKELALGKRATKRLKELVATSSMDLVKVPCACKPGTEGTDACNFGRSCGILRADGQNVGRILISEGLAVPFVCGTTSCPRMPRPWCT